MKKQFVVVYGGEKERILELLRIDYERYVAICINEQKALEVHTLEMVSLIEDMPKKIDRTLEKFLLATFLFSILMSLLIRFF